MSLLAVVRGTGSIGLRHAQVLRAAGWDVALWPVSDRSSAARDALDLTVLDDRTARSALADAALAVVATDTARHVSDALAALDAGAAQVLVEKPLSPVAADAAALLHHPRRADVHVAAPLRGHEALHEAVTAARALDGHLTVRVECQSWLPDWRPDRDYRDSYSARRDEGGVLRDLVHELDYALWAFGHPTSVLAQVPGTSVLGLDAEEAIDLLWTTAGAAVSVRLDYVTRPTRRSLTVTSGAGGVRWDATTATVTRWGPDGREQTRQHPRDLDRDTVMGRQAACLLPARATADPTPWASPATLDEAYDVVALCDAAREAATSGRSVALAARSRQPVQVSP